MKTFGKEEFYLDLNTGFIKAATDVIKHSKLYKNRFIPWTAPIPPSGRVDLAAFQQQMSKGSEQSAKDIELHEQFLKWKAEQAEIEAKKTAEKPGIPATATVVTDAGKTSDESKKVAESTSSSTGVQELTAGQRLDKIMAVIPTLTTEDFTKSANPLPTVKALSEKCGFDVEGAERDAAWEQHTKANPEWKPAEAKAKEGA